MTYTASGTYVDTVATAGCDSIVTLNLTVNQSSSSVDVVSACGSYTWINGVTYNASTNTPSVTFTNAAGCDSVVTLNLTINPSYYVTQTVSSCGFYTWSQNGMTYTQSGNYIDTTTTAGGCDSIVALSLTISNPTNTNVFATSCGSYTWSQNGMTYTTSGTYVDTVATAGCDSIVTLNLTVNQPSSSVDVVSACGSYTWINGVTYNASTNTPSITFTNAAGCDSVVTLNLTINPNYYVTQTVSSCGSYTWTQNGMTYTQSGNYIDTTTTAGGCDSIVALSLTISNPTNTNVFATSCGSYTWSQNGMTYTTSGTYVDTVATAGCDSIVTLNLTVNQPSSSVDVVSACGSYTWINGVTYNTSTNTPTMILTNAGGCDSIVTLNLTIGAANSSIDSVTACGSYTWIDGINYTNSTNSPTYTLTNAAGCDSVITLHLTINTVDVSIATSGLTMTAGANGATYQWINCSNNASISGANSQSYTAIANGDYAVVVTQNGCSDTSACVTISTVGIEEVSIADNVLIYPNPTRNNVSIEFGDLQNVDLKILSITGKLILIEENISSNKYQFDMTEHPAGVYFIEVESEGIIERFKLVKE